MLLPVPHPAGPTDAGNRHDGGVIRRLIPDRDRAEFSQRRDMCRRTRSGNPLRHVAAPVPHVRQMRSFGLNLHTGVGIDPGLDLGIDLQATASRLSRKDAVSKPFLRSDLPNLYVSRA